MTEEEEELIEVLKKLQEQVNAIDNDVYELREYIIPDEEKTGINKFEAITSIIIYLVIFLLGMIIGGEVF